MGSRPYGTNVLVTGASSGIGLACLLLFARKGYHVWGVSRSANIGQDVPDTVHLSSLDVTDDIMVASGIERIWSEAVDLTGDGIGTVVHCAGFGIGGASEDTTATAALAQFDTNYLGIVRINNALLPHMRSRGPAMVIALGSIAGRISIPFQAHYSASKFAVEAFMEALRIEGKPFGIRSCVVEAGDTKTPFTGRRQMSIPSDSPYADQARKAIGKMEKDEQNGYAPSKVASVVFNMAQRKNPPVRKPVGAGYALLMFLKRLLPDRIAIWVVTKMYIG
ncbi:MAG TPA: oxidoreductase [Sphaerochaeta sp.]|nr:MAG: hypothetical protein A2Y31_09655 [Spirochaetes bacterium GWC2_52_13]OHD62615.1 MAG: hypothetical protein A2101_07515 [Spirochaetes bacterium GWF2_52_7]HCG63161.1 oxidoreductase [Sphaerochaeta sp.]HCJ94658.1 oxidoreductase [Sphaerochaeta sp.]HCS36250.1 oxidoreductase [Sphaerochaeta sp.]